MRATADHGWKWGRTAGRSAAGGAVLGAVALGLALAYWEAHLETGSETFILDLGRHAAWAGPQAPPYSNFAAGFGDLPPAPRPGWRISAAVNWDFTLTELALYLWAATALVALSYLPGHRRWRDPFLYGVAGVGAGMTLGALGCMGLWLLAGGWGPPFPLLFAAGGAAAGALGAVVTWPLGRAEPRPPRACRRCGYDLRASKERCPECGTAIAEGGKHGA